MRALVDAPSIHMNRTLAARFCRQVLIASVVVWAILYVVHVAIHRAPMRLGTVFLCATFSTGLLWYARWPNSQK